MLKVTVRFHEWAETSKRPKLARSPEYEDMSKPGYLPIGLAPKASP